jgi:hypothetical protein
MIITQQKSTRHQNSMQLSKILARFQAMQLINLILTSNIFQCIRTRISRNIKWTQISILILLKSSKATISNIINRTKIYLLQAIVSS